MRFHGLLRDIRIYVLALLILIGVIKLSGFLHSAFQSTSIIAFISIERLRGSNCFLITTCKFVIS